jgi:hypothetical protein
MKRILVALAFCTAAGFAVAQDEDENETLAPIVVERVAPGRIIYDCAPPNGAAQCARFHELIRENFSPNEIGMLFGAATAYPEYPAAYSRTRERYIAFLQDLQDNGVPVPVREEYREDY